MEEELELFKQTANSVWFKDIPTVLVLNKSDLFKEKLKRTDLRNTLKQYQVLAVIFQYRYRLRPPELRLMIDLTLSVGAEQLRRNEQISR